MRLAGVLGCGWRVAATLCLLSSLGIATAWAEDLLADAQSGCKVKPIFGKEGVTVSWAGACNSQGLASGDGTLSWMMNGTVAAKDIGTMDDGALEGSGRRQFLLGNLSSYEGEFVAGLYDGEGHLETGKGVFYDGEFFEGKPDGTGRFQFKNGNIYEGAVAGGTQSGHGKMTWSNGDTFEGNFVDGVPQGDGVCHATDTGTTAACVFVDGKMAGWK